MKMKVLLINPQISGKRRYGAYAAVGSYQPPYGLLTIAAVLEKDGFLVKILDADSREGIPLDKLIAQAKEFSPDLIGMTSYSIGRDSLLTTAEAIKKELAVPIVVGGPHVITIPDDLAEYLFIDFLCTGEGEITMLELSQALRDKGDYENIKGIIYRKNGQSIRTPDRELVEKLDSLPFPAFHLLDDLKEYAPTPLMYKKLPVLMITTSRGCPHSCIFCNSIWSKKYRCNSAEYVVNLIEGAVKKYGFKEIMFYEDTFCLDKQRVFEICKLLRDKKIDVSWSCSSHVNHLTKEMLFEMKKAGCWIMSIGIESGNQEVLDFIKKASKLERIREVAYWAKEAGINVRGFFMIGHPIDTKKTIRQTIDFAKSLPLHTVNFCILQLLPGSEVRRIAHEYGTVDYDLSLGTGHPGNSLSFVPTGLTKEYLKSVQKRAYREFFLRPIQVWRLICSIDGFEDIKKYFLLFRTFVKLVLSKK